MTFFCPCCIVFVLVQSVNYRLYNRASAAYMSNSDTIDTTFSTRAASDIMASTSGFCLEEKNSELPVLHRRSTLSSSSSSDEDYDYYADVMGENQKKQASFDRHDQADNLSDVPRLLLRSPDNDNSDDDEELDDHGDVDDDDDDEARDIFGRLVHGGGISWAIDSDEENDQDPNEDQGESDDDDDDDDEPSPVVPAVPIRRLPPPPPPPIRLMQQQQQQQLPAIQPLPLNNMPGGPAGPAVIVGNGNDNIVIPLNRINAHHNRVVIRRLPLRDNHIANNHNQNPPIVNVNHNNVNVAGAAAAFVATVLPQDLLGENQRDRPPVPVRQQHHPQLQQRPANFVPPAGGGGGEPARPVRLPAPGVYSSSSSLDNADGVLFKGLYP